MKKYNNTKKLLIASLLLLAGCVPVRYVYVDPKDSTIRNQRVIYNDIYLHTPLYFNYPYYRPTIIYHTPIRIPSYRGGRGGRH